MDFFYLFIFYESTDNVGVGQWRDGERRESVGFETLPTVISDKDEGVEGE